MTKFMPHEAIANGCFNLNHCSSHSQIKVWEDELNNSEDVLRLLVERLEHDFVALNPKMRSPYTAKRVAAGHARGHSLCAHSMRLLRADRSQSDCSNLLQPNPAFGIAQDELQRCCCMFMACQRAFQARVPEAFFAKEMPEISKGFLAANIFYLCCACQLLFETLCAHVRLS